MTDQAPFPDRMRSLITTLVQAAHELNIGEGQSALATMRSASAQLGGLRAAVALVYGQDIAKWRRRKKPK